MHHVYAAIKAAAASDATDAPIYDDNPDDRVDAGRARMIFDEEGSFKHTRDAVIEGKPYPVKGWFTYKTKPNLFLCFCVLVAKIFTIKNFHTKYLEVKMNILVRYDKSNEAKDALKLAQKHAKAFGAKIEVARSVTRNLPLGYDVIQVTEEDLKREIQKQINGDITNYETHLLVSSNSTGQNLVQIAALKKYDEIIIGVRKRSKVGKLVLGSTAQYVILNAPCPVVSIK